MESNSNQNAVALSYGQDLWDSMHVIQLLNENRAKQMRALKSFFKNYKDVLGSF
jgi:hypothetical protein